MENELKPVVVVSKCLGFDRCRYNGQSLRSDFVEKLKPYVEFIPVCPEMAIGLGVPRDPIRKAEVDNRNMLYQPATQRDVTQDMNSFVKDFLDDLPDVEGFILKNRSPSCGISDVKVYSGLEKSARSSRGRGFFGGEVVGRFSGAAVEDEGRLRNFGIREHFLIKLFALRRFRDAQDKGGMGDLVDYHTRHKLLFLGYNETRYRNCGRVTANHDKLDSAQVYALYGEQLKILLDKPPRFTSLINTLYHAYGGISEGLSPGEKSFFINTIEEYRDERIPLDSVIRLLHAQAVRFENEYLLKQVLLSPYPGGLVEISDSGKGRDY